MPHAREARAGAGRFCERRGGRVEGGHRRGVERPAPLLARHPVPEDWRAVLAVPTAASGLSGAAEEHAFGRLVPAPERSAVIAQLVLTALLTLCLRPGGKPRPKFRKILPGAFFTAVGWHLLERLGGIYVEHVLAKASEVNGVFALTLGLIGLIYAASTIAVIGAELNSVIVHRLYPRSLLALLNDSTADLTPADHRAYAMYAQAQRHKAAETIETVMNAGESTARPSLSAMPTRMNCCTAAPRSSRPAESVRAAPSKRRSRHQVRSRRSPSPARAKPSHRKNQPISTPSPRRS